VYNIKIISRQITRFYGIGQAINMYFYAEDYFNFFVINLYQLSSFNKYKNFRKYLLLFTIFH
jgi:hypothetical protein